MRFHIIGPLVEAGAVPREERLHHVAVADHETRCQHDLGHVVDVLHGDEVFEAGRRRESESRASTPSRSPSRWRRRRSKAGDRRVPARQHRNREVEGDDGVHRKNQRRRETRENQGGALVAVPVARRAAPAEREDAEDPDLLPLDTSAIAEGGEVGDEADVPEQDRGGGVGRDREHVPDERAAELRPQAHVVRIREQPAGGEPRAAGVEASGRRGAHDGEDRHRFGKAVDRDAPVLLEEHRSPRSACRRDRYRSTRRSS